MESVANATSGVSVAVKDLDKAKQEVSKIIKSVWFAKDGVTSGGTALQIAFAYGFKDYNGYVDEISGLVQDFMHHKYSYPNKVQLKTFDELGLTEILSGIDESQHYNIVREVVLNVGYADFYNTASKAGDPSDLVDYYEFLINDVLKHFVNYHLDTFAASVGNEKHMVWMKFKAGDIYIVNEEHAIYPPDILETMPMQNFFIGKMYQDALTLMPVLPEYIQRLHDINNLINGDSLTIGKYLNSKLLFEAKGEDIEGVDWKPWVNDYAKIHSTNYDFGGWYANYGNPSTMPRNKTIKVRNEKTGKIEEESFEAHVYVQGLRNQGVNQVNTFIKYNLDIIDDTYEDNTGNAFIPIEVDKFIKEHDALEENFLKDERDKDGKCPPNKPNCAPDIDTFHYHLNPKYLSTLVSLIKNGAIFADGAEQTLVEMLEASLKVVDSSRSSIDFKLKEETAFLADNIADGTNPLGQAIKVHAAFERQYIRSNDAMSRKKWQEVGNDFEDAIRLLKYYKQKLYNIQDTNRIVAKNAYEKLSLYLEIIDQCAIDHTSDTICAQRSKAWWEQATTYHLHEMMALTMTLMKSAALTCEPSLFAGRYSFHEQYAPWQHYAEKIRDVLKKYEGESWYQVTLLGAKYNALKFLIDMTDNAHLGRCEVAASDYMEFAKKLPVNFAEVISSTPEHYHPYVFKLYLKTLESEIYLDAAILGTAFTEKQEDGLYPTIDELYNFMQENGQYMRSIHPDLLQGTCSSLAGMLGISKAIGVCMLVKEYTYPKIQDEFYIKYTLKDVIKQVNQRVQYSERTERSEAEDFSDAKIKEVLEAYYLTRNSSGLEDVDMDELDELDGLDDDADAVVEDLVTEEQQMHDDL